MAQRVRRARVEYRIILVGPEGPDGEDGEDGEDGDDGEETTSVYRETFRANEANQWHDRRVDLSPWEGQTIVLTFSTQTIPPRENVPCGPSASRLRGEIRSLPNVHGTCWRIASNGSPPNPSIGLGEQFDDSGLGPDEQVMTARFFINLLVGGLLALAIRELYRRYSSTVINRESFADMLPLFTLSTIVVISVVQYSPALALRTYRRLVHC